MRFFKFFIYSLIFCGAFSSVEVSAAVKTSAIKDLRYPMHVSVPAAGERTGDMIIALTRKKDTKAVAKEWSQAQKGFLVLAVDIELKDGEQPTYTDQWILNLKREMTLRYNVKRFYLLGYDERAHYVSYFGLQHPRAFTAYAAIGGSWAGPFEKIVRPTDKARKQAPFFIAMPKEEKVLDASQNYAKDLTSKGYNVRFVVFEKVGEDSSLSFLNDLMVWFQEQNQKQEAYKNRPKTFKDKVSEAKEEFFALN